MRQLLDTGNPLFMSYFIGFVLALMLTIASFGLVELKLLPVVPTLALIAALAVTQIIVHLHYFLHVDFTLKQRANLLSLVFAAIVIFIMVGGTAWIIFNLQYRMMV